MTISKYDLISLIILVIFAWRGYRRGAMNALIGLIGIMASFLVPWLTAPWLAGQLMQISAVQSTMTAWLGGAETEQTALLAAASNVLELTVFILLFILMCILVGRIKRSLRRVNRLPVIGTLNRLSGALIGAAAAGIVLTAFSGILYYFAQWTNNVDLQGSLLNSSILTLFLYVMN